jgi:hypothetical protein
MVVFGGAGLDKDDSSVNLADLHVLDTAALVWSQPQMNGSHIPQVCWVWRVWRVWRV